MDEERKSKRPKGVKKEDWIKFVDPLSIPEEQAKREKGNAARSKIHSPYTTDSCQNLRTKVDLKECMNMAIQKDPMLMDKDLDNDAVAVEYGADGNGHVRGYNGHLNKTNIRVSTPLRRVIEWGRVKQAMLNEVQEILEVEANECRQFEKRVAAFESHESLRGAYMHRPFENNVSTSQGRRCSPLPPESSSGNSCILKDMFGINVSYGTVQFNTTAPDGFYCVIIDEVVREEVRLYVESRTLGDVSAEFKANPGKLFDISIFISDIGHLVGLGSLGRLVRRFGPLGRSVRFGPLGSIVRFGLLGCLVNFGPSGR
ncbi:hypothetical protein GIB67_034405 [Kingdonia uniflora]|uniref:Uncharacterized protein n=1 Tax=Kingdonia uniflora TaxID=39325 RepID=A0A7J7NSE3_9MAGN|nr:hypothetical protein GIB67_034405 [Kingdonia uniflora]